MTPNKPDPFYRGLLIGIPYYLLIACWTYGFAVADLRSSEPDPAQRDAKASLQALVWPLYWPTHWSVQFWEAHRP